MTKKKKHQYFYRWKNPTSKLLVFIDHLDQFLFGGALELVQLFLVLPKLEGREALDFRVFLGSLVFIAVNLDEFDVLVLGQVSHFDKLWSKADAGAAPGSVVVD